MVAEELKRRLVSGEYILIAPATKTKSEVCKSFGHVCNENNEPSGYVKYKTCDILLKYDSKMTGTLLVMRHADRSCSTPASAQDQPTIKLFVTASKLQR